MERTKSEGNNSDITVIWSEQDKRIVIVGKRIIERHGKEYPNLENNLGIMKIESRWKYDPKGRKNNYRFIGDIGRNIPN